MREADREAARKRADCRCDYCGVREEDVGSRLIIDSVAVFLASDAANYLTGITVPVAGGSWMSA